MKIKQSVRRPTECVLSLVLAAAMATACLGQDFMPPPGPSGNGPGPGYSIPPNQPPSPVPGYSIPPSQPPNPDPGFPIPSNPQFGSGSPVVQPGSWSPPAGAAGPDQSPVLMGPSGPPPAQVPGLNILPEQSPVPSGPSPDSQEKSNDGWLPDDMMGFGGMGGMGGSRGGMNPSDSVRYSVLWFPNVPVQGQATDLQVVGENLSFTHPLWKDSLNALSFSGGVRNQLFVTDAILPDTGQPLPSELWGVNLGLRYNRQLDDGWSVGGGVSIGSASDHPFAGIHEMNVGMNAMLRIPQGEHNAWLFTLSYAPMGELNFPIPGVAFSWNPSPQFHANIGLPLMVMWRPTDDWQFQASYMLIRTVHIKAQYRLTDWLRAFAAYDWSNESYILLDSPDPNDRFFIYDQRVSMGLQATLLRQWTASVSGGFVFDRYMFEGTSSNANSSTADRVDLGNGPFAAMNLGVRY